MIGTRAEDFPSCHQNSDMMCLRDYVCAGDATRFDHQAQGTLRIDISHSNLLQRWHDIVFDDNMTIDAVKTKLYRHGGTPNQHQELYLRKGGSDTIFLMDTSKTLRYYGARNGMEIHIKDTDPHSLSLHGGLEDVSQVVKYEIAEEDYDKLENSVRAIKRREKAKQEQAKAAAQAEREARGEELGSVPEEPEVNLEKLTADFPIDSRCEVQPGARRGAVAFVGKVTGIKGLFIGVRLDEPQGMNDGSGKDGTRYFDCPGPKYGCFVKAEHITIGDFPERDPFASDDEF